MKKIILTNEEIYFLSQTLFLSFKDAQQYIPIKIYLPIQKNISLLSRLSKEIEEYRMSILEHFGTDYNNKIIIPEDKITYVNNELKDLLEFSQELSIYTIKLSDISEESNLTYQQLESIMFMIDIKED